MKKKTKTNFPYHRSFEAELQTSDSLNVKRTHLSKSFGGHYQINLHANLHTQTFDFMSPGRRKKKKSHLMISGVVLLRAVSSGS